MISGIKPTALMFRDGTSQSDRLNAALDPQTIPVDERTTADLLRFAQAFAQKLRFYEVMQDATGEDALRSTATWEGLLIDQFPSYSTSTPEEQNRLRESWIADLVDYIDHPEKYTDDADAMNRFGRPHLALFVTFLQLLGVIRSQLNGFTKRHLDFYYKEVLGLTPREPVPDHINVIIQLADNVNDFILANGTLFTAGKDKTGKELIYRSVADTHITRATVASIRNVFTEKRITGIREARETNKTEPELGILEMLELALGDPSPGNKLPKYNNKAFNLAGLRADYKNEATRAKAVEYGKDSLYMPEPDLRAILNLDERSGEAEWDAAYELLDTAYKEKVRYNRKQALRARREKPQTGFLDMFQYALGAPNPDDPLPEYRGKPVGLAELAEIDNALTEGTPQAGEAQRYVRESLLLKEPDFHRCMEANSDPSKADWDAVYTIVEKAQSQKRDFEPGEPYTVAYTDICSIKDAREGLFRLPGEEGSDERFKTFGKHFPNKPAPHIVSAGLGFAISSPQLLLTEGDRIIDITYHFISVPEDLVLPADLKPYICFYLSGDEHWAHVDPAKLEIRDVKPTASDVQRHLYFDVQLKLSENDPALTTPGTTDNFADFHSDAPTVALLLNNIHLPEGTVIPYPELKDLKLEDVAVSIAVDQLSVLTLQNDNAAINPKKPFEPFGTRPVSGNTFYFAHPELSRKKLDSLTVHFEWMKPPKSFTEHYLNYVKIDKGSATAENDSLTNASFTARLRMKDKNTMVPISAVELFDSDDATKTQSVDVDLNDTLKTSAPGFNYVRLDWPPIKGDIFSWPRYFQLELGTPDLQHDAYPLLMTKQAYLGTDATSTALKQLVLNPPYTPKLKSFRVSYKASFTIRADEKSQPFDRIYHVHPFGYSELLTVMPSGDPARITLLPDYTNEGELYIGIAGLGENRRLSILFAMAEGSADPDTERPEFIGNYLSNNTWKQFPAGNFIEDGTGGLLHTGIVQLVMPEDATNTDTLINGNLHWIRIAVAENTTAVTDTVNILTQSVQAVFVDNGNDPDHLLTVLDPGSVKGTTVRMPQIREVVQPYSSTKGKPAETGIDFYNRVSERLRHKNRAITMWDYERIVLDAFPEVHKVKCVPADFSNDAENYGKVDVIVIPDIKGKLPFNPYEPKVSSDLLVKIRAYLEQRMPAFAEVDVRNASFVQVKTRFTVKFNQIGNERFLSQQLENELKRYLAPWAFDDGADIALGGKIYASMLINFIAERPYVDYVAGIKLFRSNDGIRFTESFAEGSDEYTVSADAPDVILVSALDHEIDVVSEKGFEEKDFTGINYMKIELDFSIG